MSNHHDALHSERCLPCRHLFDESKLQRVETLLTQLNTTNPEILFNENITQEEWPALLRTAVESMRGTFAASGGEKKRFTEAMLARMLTAETISEWAFIGTRQRQDYRVRLPNGRNVSVEAKGCGDGNNMNIWDRPAWADEFVIWSQCPESLQHEPGEGVWSALATRILSKIVADRQLVDCFIFFDGRCGSAQRICPKNPAYGVEGSLRAGATDYPGQNGREWLPPPCIYILPRQAPDAIANPEPLLHSLDTCQFAAALLRAFNVPESDIPASVHWAKVKVQNRDNGRYYQPEVGTNLITLQQLVEGRWKRHTRG